MGEYLRPPSLLNGYDLSGLIEKLKPMAKDEAKNRKQKKNEDGRRRRGHLEASEV